MRRWITLSFLTVLCWGLAVACSNDGGAPQSPEAAPGAGGPTNPQVSGGSVVGNADGSGGDGVEVQLLPIPVLSATIDGKAVVQDGVYAATELKAHAGDAKAQATTFHWSLVGPGINGGQFADGADASFKLPVITDKSAYELTVIGKLGGKAVYQTINFFTVPKPTATIKANVNQAAGPSVLLSAGGSVLKGQKIQFSADAQFADLFKWKIVKDNGAATDLGQDSTADFAASTLGSYKVLLMAFGPGGNTGLQPLEFKFEVKDNVVPVMVEGTVTKDSANYSGKLVNKGQYPIGSTVTIDATKMEKDLSAMNCTVLYAEGKGSAEKLLSSTVTKSIYLLNTAGLHNVKCKLALKPDLVAQNPGDLEFYVEPVILPKAKAAILVEGKNCDATTPLLFEVKKTVKLSAAGSTGNISSYSWSAGLAQVANADKVDASLELKMEGAYSPKLDVTGIGDADSASCTVNAKPPPNAVIASDPTVTVQAGRSYIAGSTQRAHAAVKSGSVTDFVWSLVNGSGSVLKISMVQKPSDIFEFLLSETGPLTLNLSSKFDTLTGPSNSRPFTSKTSQVLLVRPLNFSNIQSFAAVSETDVYFASPSAIFHKGVDGRVVQVKNIFAHPARPDGFFARHAGDIYLLTTDGGYWRYTYKGGWEYKSLGFSGLAMTGPANGTGLLVAADNKRLYAGDAGLSDWQVISGKAPQHLATIGSAYYTLASKGSDTDSGVMKCSPSSCATLEWKVNNKPLVEVTWKAIGASDSEIYLSDANGRIHMIQNNVITKSDALAAGDYIVAFSRPNASLFAISNMGNVYRVTPDGTTLHYKASATVTSAAGSGSTFWAWDSSVKAVMQAEGANTQTMLYTQNALGTTQAPCLEQKRIWMVGETAYVSVCVLENNAAPRYEIWSVPYQGEIAMVNKEAMPVIAVGSDGLGGLLIMRSDGTKGFVKQLKADGTLQSLSIALANGEVLTGMSDRFLTTNLGIWYKSGQTCKFVQPVPDARYPVAVGGVLYVSVNNDTRLARFDLVQNKLDTIANSDSIVDITADTLGRVYVLTDKALYRYEDKPELTEIYQSVGTLKTGMALINDHHTLISMASKGLALVDVNKKEAQMINPDAEVGEGMEAWGVGYNGTGFLFFGRAIKTGVLILGQFGAPQ